MQIEVTQATFQRVINSLTDIVITEEKEHARIRHFYSKECRQLAMEVISHLNPITKYYFTDTTAYQ